ECDWVQEWLYGSTSPPVARCARFGSLSAYWPDPAPTCQVASATPYPARTCDGDSDRAMLGSDAISSRTATMERRISEPFPPGGVGKGFDTRPGVPCRIEPFCPSSASGSASAGGRPATGLPAGGPP